MPWLYWAPRSCPDRAGRAGIAEEFDWRPLGQARLKGWRPEPGDTRPKDVDTRRRPPRQQAFPPHDLDAGHVLHEERPPRHISSSRVLEQVEVASAVDKELN